MGTEEERPVILADITKAFADKGYLLDDESKIRYFTKNTCKLFRVDTNSNFVSAYKAIKAYVKELFGDEEVIHISALVGEDVKPENCKKALERYLKSNNDLFKYYKLIIDNLDKGVGVYRAVSWFKKIVV